MRVLEKLKFEREAMLFDTPIFLVKIFVSVLTAYGLFHNHSIIGKDMISLLFGMMLTLEPVNLTGLRGGFFQVKASIIGGILTALIIAVFGVNVVTVPLAVTMTMYVTLKMNWREVSVVAMFTSIYMTQYIQMDAIGAPSMILTLRLRLMALGTGVLVALFYNFVFSKVTYGRFTKKRTLYLIERMSKEFSCFVEDIDDAQMMVDLKRRLSAFFTDFDFILNHLGDIEKEAKHLNTSNYIVLVKKLRDVNHYFLDLVMDHINSPLEQEEMLRLIDGQLKTFVKAFDNGTYLEGLEFENDIHWKFERLITTLNEAVDIKIEKKI